MHIHLDAYLETGHGRVWTKSRNCQAWVQCFHDLEREVTWNRQVKKIYILIGCQASGKTTWAKFKHQEEPNNIIFDAILVKRCERKKILKIAKKYQMDCIAIFFIQSLDLCLVCNRLRPSDRFVSESALKNVHAAIEPPSIEEGFSDIICVYSI